MIQVPELLKPIEPTAPDAPPSKFSPLAEAAAALGRDASQDFVHSMETVAKINPDSYAKATAVSRYSGISPKMLHDHRERMDQLLRGNEYAGIYDRYRKTANALRDGNLAAISQDDLDQLTRIEGAASDARFNDRSTGEKLWDAVSQAWTAMRQAGRVERAIDYQGELERFDEIDRAEAAGEIPLGTLEQRQQAGTYGLQYLQATPGQRAQIRDIVATGQAKRLSMAAENEAELAAYPVDPGARRAAELEAGGQSSLAATAEALLENPGYAVRTSVGAAVSSAPMLIAGAIAGPAAGGAIGFSMERDAKLLDVLREAGVDPADPKAVMRAMQDDALMADAEKRANLKAIGTTAVDTLSMGLASKLLVPSRIAGRSLSTTQRELANLAVQFPVQGITEGAGEAAGQFLAEGEVDAGEVLLETVAGAGMSSVDVLAFSNRRFIEYIGDGLRKARQARAGADVLGEMADAAKSSKTRGRDVETFRSIAEKQLEGSPVETIWLPAEALQQLNQSGQVKLPELLREVPGLAEQFADAAARGGSVSMKTSDYLAVFADYHDQLAGNVRIQADGLSPADVDAWNAEQEAQLDALAEQMRTPEDPANAARNEIVGQLVSAGYRRADAEQYAATHLAVLQTLSERTGVALNDLADRFDLNISTQAPEQLRAVSVDDARLAIQRLRAGDIPKPSDMFGQSLREFLVAQGGVSDEGGELAALDADVGKVGRNRLARKGGKSLDDMALQAWERGYFPGVPVEQVGPQLIVDAIQQEMAGNPVYSVEQENATLRGQADTLNQLSDYLDQLGVDIADMSDDEVLALLQGGGEPVVDGQRLDQFAGPTAWTADTVALAEAKQRIEDGEPAESVRRDTGWFVGADGKWRFEIDDSKARFRGFDPEIEEPEVTTTNPDAFMDWIEEAAGRENGIPLDQALNHPALFAAYPELARVRLKVDPNRSAGGYFAAQPGRGLTGSFIVIGEPFAYPSEVTPALDVLLHEIQHAIQTREGFATGGSPDVLRAEKDQARADFKYWAAVATLRREAERLGGDYEQAAVDYKDIFEEQPTDQQIEDARSAESLEQLQQRTEAAEQVMRNIGNPTATYKRLAGEIEARNTEARRTMTAEERRLASPEQTADTPGEQAIVWWNGTEMVSHAVNQQEAGAVRLNQAAQASDLQRALAMGEDEYIATINPSGETNTEDGSARLVRGDLSDPVESTVLATLDNGVTIERDAEGSFYAREGGDTLGEIIDYGDEVNVNVLPEARGQGIAVALAAEFMRENPFFDAGSLTPGGEAVVRAAFRKLKAEQAEQRLNQGETRQQLESRLVESHPGLKLNLLGSGKRLLLSRIELPKDGREQGAGTQIMREIVAWADANDVTVSLSPSADFGGNKKRLTEFYKRFGFIENKGKNRDFEVSEAMYREPSQTLEQDGDDTARGFITFKPRQKAGEQRKFQITLGAKRDLTTLLHELGHFYLEVLDDIAATDAAPDQIKRDVATIRDWVGAKAGAGFTVEQHEQFARGFERYLAEGKAPNPELAGAFARFKRWIIGVYKDLTRLNVELSDDVRKVFDRLVATDEQIMAAEQVSNAIPLFADAQAAGMTDEAFAKYQDSIALSHADAQERIEREIQREEDLRRSKWWRDETERVRQEVAEEVDTLPVYAAMRALRRGDMPDGTKLSIKLNSGELTERYGASVTRRLAFTHSKTGQDIDLVGSMLGFDSGDALVKAILGAVPRSDLIKQETERRMLERHGPKSSGEAADLALEAVHNERRTDVLLLELQALGKQGNRKNITSQQILKEAARRVMAERKVRDIQPAEYQRAEAKAAREAFDAASKGKLAVAYEAKQRQLLNFYLYREAVKARESVNGIVARMAKYNKRSTRERLGKAGHDYLDQIDALMEQYEFRTVSLRKLDKRVTFQAWYADQLAQGNEPFVPEFVLNTSGKVNYKDLSLDQLQELDEFAKNISHLARTKNKLLANQRLRDFDEARAELIRAGYSNPEKRKASPIDKNTRGLLQQVSDQAGEFSAALLKMEQIVDWLDGGQVDGPWTQVFWQPFVEAQAEKERLNREFAIKMTELVDAYTAERGAKVMKQQTHIASLGQPLTHNAILSAALNTGNEGNRTKLLNGGHNGSAWTEQQLNEILGNLDKRDWQFVQSLWDLVEELWPSIEQLEKDLHGIPPAKVEAVPVVNQHGTFRGGYWPIVYDTSSSAYAGVQNKLGNEGGLFEQGYARATTPKGHTKARVDSFAAPIMLDVEIVAQHLGQVIHDLTHRKAIRDGAKIIGDKQIKQMLIDTLGPQVANQFNPWLQGVANDMVLDSQKGIDAWTKAAERLRANLAVGWMGFSATTGLQQILGYSQSIEYLSKIGAKRYIFKGMHEFIRAPFKAMEFVNSLSPEMRYRVDNLDRDMRGVMKKISGKSDALSIVQRLAFKHIAVIQALVDYPTWLAGYHHGLDSGLSPADAIVAGDRAVRLSQMAAGPKDLAAIQRKDGLMRALTLVYSYFNLLYNRSIDLRNSVAAAKSVGDYLNAFERTMFLIAIPAVVAPLVSGQGPGEDEDWRAWAALKIATYPLLGIPVLRDLASSIESGWAYKGATPLGELFSTLSKLRGVGIKAAEGEEQDTARLAGIAIDAIGYGVGLPTAQPKRTIKYLIGVAEGDIEPEGATDWMRGVIFGPPKE